MAESMIQSVIKCPICLEAYDDPRVLSCLHSFCQKCLNGYILNMRMGPGQLSFTCPVCREEIFPPFPYRPLWQWSTQFRSNFIMTDLASCLTEVSKAKEEQESKPRGEVCYPCSKQMATLYPKEAEHFCLDCSHPYCEACMQVHMSIPSCQKHPIVPIDDKSSREQHKKEHLSCTEHPEEVLKMFCEDCNQLLCPMCALLKHRQCGKLNSVTPVAAARRSQLETSQRSLQSTLSKARERQLRLHQEKEKLAQNITASLREMDEAYDSLITTIKEQKRGDMIKSHEAITKTQHLLSSCEEQISVFIAVLEENVCKTQCKQLISSDVQLLQEVSQMDLKEAENDIAAATAFLSQLEGSRFDVPGLAKKKLEELKRMMRNMTLLNTATPNLPQKPRAGNSNIDSPQKATGLAIAQDRSPEKDVVSVVVRGSEVSFTLQRACRSVMSTSSDISAASTSSSEGSMACGHSSDGQRNPFSITAGGRRSMRRPTARPRHSLARRSLAGASVFSVKHPVVTAANSSVSQSSPKKCCADSSGFIFVPAKNVPAVLSQFKPIPKSGATTSTTTAAVASDDSVLNRSTLSAPSTSAVSGSHTLPKSTQSRPLRALAAASNLPASSTAASNVPASPPRTSISLRSANAVGLTKGGKERVAQTSAASSVTISTATMTSPNTTISTSHSSSSAEDATNIPSASGDNSPQLNGATGPADLELEASVGRLASGGEAAAASGDVNPRLMGALLQKADNQKMKSIFKICPTSPGDLRRPSVSDFTVLPSDQVVVVDRANSRVKLVSVTPEGQEEACPFVDLTKPHGVCHMTGDTIAVVSHVAKTLQLLSVANRQLSLQHTHNTCRGYLNIARLSPTFLAARFSLGVHILDVGGPALRLKATITTDGDGRALFDSPISMCTTPDSKVIILDNTRLELSSWDQNGEQLWCVKLSMMSLPRCVCSVGLRRLYVISSADGMDCLNCLNTSSGKLLHSVRLETSLREASTMAQDSKDRVLINNVDEIVCFDWN